MNKKFWIKNKVVFENEIENFDETVEIEIEKLAVFYMIFITFKDVTKYSKQHLKYLIRKDFSNKIFDEFKYFKISSYKFDDVTYILRCSIYKFDLTFQIYESGLIEFVNITENKKEETFFQKLKNYFK